jgi:hypothetical protein
MCRNGKQDYESFVAKNRRSNEFVSSRSNSKASLCSEFSRWLNNRYVMMAETRESCNFAWGSGHRDRNERTIEARRIYKGNRGTISSDGSSLEVTPSTCTTRVLCQLQALALFVFPSGYLNTPQQRLHRL